MKNIINNLASLVKSQLKNIKNKCNEHKKNRDIGKIILMIIACFLSFALLLVVLACITLGAFLVVSILCSKSFNYIYTYYPEGLIIGIIIIVLCICIKFKRPSSSVEPVMAPQVIEINQDKVRHKADARLKMITDIMFACIKEVASKIKCVSPEKDSEIIDINNQIEIEENVAFFIFRLEKEDYNTIYDDNVLNNVVTTIQYKLDHLTSSGKLRLYGFPTERDAFNERLNRICVDDVLDSYKQYLYVWVTFDTPEYSDYLNRENMKQSTNCIHTAPPNASWDDADV